MAGPGFNTYLNQPTSLQFDPHNKNHLWVANKYDDSMSVIDIPANPLREDVFEFASGIVGNHYQDGYAEHFMDYPMGFAFSDSSDKFAIIGDNNNCVRGMDFQLSPERNMHFKCNNFMGPTLFGKSSFAKVRQDKAFMQDWRAPGQDRVVTLEVPPCRAKKPVPDVCFAEGSHMDMLHETPNGMGIAHYEANQFYVNDGFYGMLTLYDFNYDHLNGNTFHADGRVVRFSDVILTREPGVHSGMVFDSTKEWLYIADTGAGRIIRVNVESGTPYQWISSYYDWMADLEGVEGSAEPVVYGKSVNVNGVIHEIGSEPGTKDIHKWVQDKGNTTAMEMTGAQGFPFITPMEPLAYYGSVLGAEVEVVTTHLMKPSGLVFLPSGRLAAADYGTGDVIILEQSTTDSTESEWAVVDTFEASGYANSTMGLAVLEDKLYYVDNAQNKVGVVGLQC